ncbi:MAG: hypothetical protein AABW48_03360 [Nanoarchaeota archaeon]
MMKKRPYIWLFGLVILITLALAVNVRSSLWTETLSPSSANLCGMYEKNLTLTAAGIVNQGNVTLENVTAKLIIEPDNGGLFIVNEMPAMLGDIISLNKALIEPSWEIYCNEKYPGNYTLYVDYFSFNEFGLTEPLASSKNQAMSAITVYPAAESMPPIVLTHLPTGKIITPYATLEITTNEEAVCKYSTSEGVAYDNMIFFFDVTGGTTHRKTITELTDNTYHYYVKCKDSLKNKAQEDYKIIFDVDIPPTASIELNKPLPLKAGLVEITIRTSEEVKPIPALSYSFDGSTKTNVPLSGSGTTWTGYLLLQNSNSNEVGSFYFSGMDLTGNTGNTITSGNLFLVDTEPPGAPTMLEARENKGGVKLTWRQNEEIDHYLIYRSTSSEPGFALYETTKDKYFVDARVVPRETYHYRVSAVDLAGNEGSLPEEVQITVMGTENVPATSKLTLPAPEKNSAVNITMQLEEINTAVTAVDHLLEELNGLREKLKDIGAEEQELLKIPTSIKNNKVVLLKMKEELGNLKTEELDSLTATQRLQEINEEIEAIKSQTLKEISYAKETAFAQDLQTDLQNEYISTLLKEILQTENIEKSGQELNEYISKTEQFQENIEIKTKARELLLTYLNGSKEKVILVKKEIVVKNGNLANVMLIENIPKNVANTTDELVFDSNFQVVKEDPILKRNVNTLNTINYVYLINNNNNNNNNNNTLDSIKEIKTAVFPEYQEFVKEKTTNLITGLSVVSFYENTSFYDISIAFGIILIIALALYFFIYANKNTSKAVILAPHPLREQIAKNKIKKTVKERIKEKIRDALKKINGKRAINNKKESKKAVGEAAEEEALNYLNYAAQEYKEAGLVRLEDLTMPFLIEKVDASLNEMNFSQAFKLHYLLLSNLGLNPAEKNRAAKEQLTRIHKKANLLRKINQLHFFAEQKEHFLALKHMLNDIAGLYNELVQNRNEQERELFEKAKQIHDTYSRIILNK